MAAERLTVRSLRRQAIARSLFEPTTLQGALDRLGFVQADPIRSPARAQDLILRHRVHAYRANDLERQYASLDVEEDYLYAYGFLSRRVWRLLHPRPATALRALEKKVLETVLSLGEAHPGALETHLGKRRGVNEWGGYSKATTIALEWLHWRGLLRIARRERGVRVYQPAPPLAEPAKAQQRLRELVLLLASVFAPTPESSLRAVIARYRDLGDTRQALSDLVGEGELRQQSIAGVRYVWPTPLADTPEVPRRVRFLSPFDPVVWDRRRFEHVWGWSYRFEAYTPRAKRVRGYYAMPLLWGDEFVGWANADPRVMGAKAEMGVDVSVGFVKQRPGGRDFTRELDAEIARLELFLGGTRKEMKE